MKLSKMMKKVKALRVAHAAGETVNCECLTGDGEGHLCGRPAVGHAGNGKAVGHLRDIGGVAAVCEEHLSAMQPIEGDAAGFAHRW